MASFLARKTWTELWKMLTVIIMGALITLVTIRILFYLYSEFILATINKKNLLSDEKLEAAFNLFDKVI